MAMDSMVSAAGEFLALVWMELLMCGIAALAYAAFIGRDKLPPALQTQMKKKVDLEDDQPTNELDVVSRDLQQKVSANDHRGVFKIWQLRPKQHAPQHRVPREDHVGEPRRCRRQMVR